MNGKEFCEGCEYGVLVVEVECVCSVDLGEVRERDSESESVMEKFFCLEIVEGLFVFWFCVFERLVDCYYGIMIR